MAFILFFPRLFVTLNKFLTLDNKNKNKLLFCIVLAYS